MKYFFVFILSIILILITTKTVSAAGANPFCLGASGQFSAFAWPGGTIDVACAGDTGSAGCTGHVVSLQPGQSYDFNNCTCSPWGMERDNGTTSPFSSGCIYIGRDLRLVQHANGNRTVEGDKSLPAGCSLNKPNPIACGANGQVISMPFTITCVPSPTPTRTPTLPPSVTPTQTPTVTPTRTPSPSPTRTPTPTITSTPSPTRTPSPTNTMTPTLTPTNTLTPTSTPPPSSCPVPEQVPNVRIDCPFCEL